MHDNKDKLKEITEKIVSSNLLKLDDIPKIDLYMEQTISFLEQEMGDTLRRNDEAVFTKTMVNNYVKFGILPRPEKKRYNKEHMIYLVYIFFLKQILSIQDIKMFFSLLDGQEDESEETPSENERKLETSRRLEALYKVFTDMLEEFRADFMQFKAGELEKIDRKLAENNISNENMELMSFISLTAFEANINKMLCSQLIDAFGVPEPETSDKEKDKEKDRDKEKSKQKEK